MVKGALYALILCAAFGYGVVAGRRELPPVPWIKAAFDRVTGVLAPPAPPIPPPDPVVADLISARPGTLDSLRTRLADLVYGSHGIPKGMPDSLRPVVDTAYAGMEGLGHMERFVIVQEHDIRSVGYIFHPTVPNGRLLIYHQGHDGDFIAGKGTIAHFVRQGFTAYAFCMPLLGKNNQPLVNLGKLGNVRLYAHQFMQYLDHPIRFFTAPVATMLNHAERQGFQDVTMTGISGGGWTTHLVSAMDTRIDKSFPVAGSYPMFIRFQRPQKNMGDVEQYLAALYPEVDYLDMYVMASVGPGRSQTQVLNTYDPCCFDGNDHQKYEQAVAQAVDRFAAGRFRVFADSTNKTHSISDRALQEMSRELGLDAAVRE